MKTLTKIALVATLVSVGLHLYLSFHYYPLKFGFSTGPSICTINTVFDCDAVSASSYANLFGIPMAVWGMATNLVLFGLILMAWWQWTESPERLKRWAVALSGISVVGSIVMGGISALFLKNYCIFCITLYVLSLIIFVCLIKTLVEPFFAGIKKDLPELLGAAKGIPAAFVAIPVLAFFIHQGFLQHYNAGQLQQIVRSSIEEWQAATPQSITTPPTLATGADKDHATLTLKEFADFRCSHCRHASPSLNAFVRSHPDVRLEFYSWPLDGKCHANMPEGSGASCRLAEAVYCAEKQGHGWAMHDLVYETQPEINGLDNNDALVAKIKSLAESLGIDTTKMLSCMEESATKDAILEQAKQGDLLQVQGTPTIFANGRELMGAQLLPVLEAVRKTTIQKSE